MSQHPLNVTVLAYNSEQEGTPANTRKRVWQDDSGLSKIDETLTKKTRKVCVCVCVCVCVFNVLSLTDINDLKQVWLVSGTDQN